MPVSAEPLVSYLRQLEAQGQTHVNIDDEARVILRAFYKNTIGQGAAAQKSVDKAPQPAARENTPAPASDASDSGNRAETSVVVNGSSPAEKIDSLRRLAEKWQPARSLGSLRQTMVFSTGNPEADIMLVGEAPGFDEERLREPFVGKAGQKLNDILRAMGIGRKQCYISNIVKFRPAMQNQTTNNRKPTAEEMASCMPFIEKEVNIVQPKVIIALGGTAAQGLLDRADSVARMRGTFHTYQGIPLRVTYHPSYILHNEATSEKRKLWEDMLEVMTLLGMPISAKQQSFFLPKQ